MRSKQKLIHFIENENAFQVMGELKKNGILTKEDVTHAMSLSREEWLKFMKEKAGISDD